MTKLLEEAFKKASDLPENIQDSLGTLLIQEIEDELHWDKSLSETPELLERLAEKALHEYQSGNTHKMGFNEL
jgi:hypothetical protein